MLRSFQGGRFAEFLGFSGRDGSGNSSPPTGTVSAPRTSQHESRQNPDTQKASAISDVRRVSASQLSPSPQAPPFTTNMNQPPNLFAHQQEGESIDRSFRRALRRRERLQRVRDEVLHLRVKVDYERQKMVETRRFYHQSLSTFTKALQRAKGESTSVDVYSELHNLQSKLNTDDDTAQQQLDATRVLEHSLSNLEFRQSKLEAAHFESLEQIHVGLSIGPLAFIHGSAPRPQSDAQSRGSKSHRSSSPQLHPDLAMYYDKLGDIGLLGENLANLEAEYREAVRDREFRIDHEQRLSFSDGDFESRFKKPMEEAAGQLDLAVLAVEDLRQLCIRQGIDVNGGVTTDSELTDDFQHDPMDDVEHFHMSLGSAEVSGEHMQSHLGSQADLRGALLLSEREGRDTIISGRYDDRSPSVSELSDKEYDYIVDWSRHIVNDAPETAHGSATLDCVERSQSAPVRASYGMAILTLPRPSVATGVAGRAVKPTPHEPHGHSAETERGTRHTDDILLRPSSFPLWSRCSHLSRATIGDCPAQSTFQL